MDRRDWQNLAGAAVAALLLFGCWWFMTELHRRSQLETCLMRRQLNCSRYGG